MDNTYNIFIYYKFIVDTPIQVFVISMTGHINFIV